MLQLVGEIKSRVCDECGGEGKVPCPPTLSVRSTGANGFAYPQPSDGHPIPCPKCNGKKVL